MNIEGFELVEVLGERTGSDVWTARQTSLDRVVALRVFPPGRLPEEELSAILRDVSATARVKHPNLVQIYDVGKASGSAYVVMEYIEGKTVERMVEEGGPLAERTILKVAESVASALDAVWRGESLPHGNIHPGNILFDRAGLVRLADMGCTPVCSEPTGQPRPLAFANPSFKSPEHAIGLSTRNFRTDMYCLGATLYFLATGQRPFHGYEADTVLAMHVDGFLQNPREINPALSAMATKLIGRLLAKSPDHRHEDWGAAVEEIQAVAAGRILIRKTGVNPASSLDRRMRGGRAGSRLRRRSTDRARGAPSWLKRSAWLLLFVFWVFLAYRQATDPILPVHRLPALSFLRGPDPAGRPDAASTAAPAASQAPAKRMQTP